jgi:phospholipid/cholesterol/gamma-HCH transport system permease protein
MRESRLLDELGVMAWMANRILRRGLTFWRHRRPFYRRHAFKTMAKVGGDSLPIVTLAGISAGVILALQSALQLEKVGAISYVSSMVSATVIHEMGPLLTAILVAGRSGAAFTAEIGAMQIAEEIDALEVMGLDPVRFLVWPKLMAMLIMLPCLTAWASFVAIAAAAVFAALTLNIAPADFVDNSFVFVGVKDLLNGMVKSLSFGVGITLISCWQGFLARKGASDVGDKTTRSVVQSIFLIILLDLFFTALKYVVR